MINIFLLINKEERYVCIVKILIFLLLRCSVESILSNFLFSIDLRSCLSRSSTLLVVILCYRCEDVVTDMTVVVRIQMVAILFSISPSLVFLTANYIYLLMNGKALLVNCCHNTTAAYTM